MLLTMVVTRGTVLETDVVCLAGPIGNNLAGYERLPVFVQHGDAQTM